MNKNLSKDLSVTKENIDITLKSGDVIKMPLMRVIISGTPKFSEVVDLMKEIKRVSGEFEEEYISVTDMSDLKINKLLQTLILNGMQGSYKKLLSVENPSKLSFVILNSDSEGSSALKKSLEDINEINVNEKDYKYKYVFLNDESKVSDVAGELLGE